MLQTVVHKAAERGILIMLDMHRAGDDEKFELWYTSKSVWQNARTTLPQTTLIKIRD